MSRASLFHPTTRFHLFLGLSWLLLPSGSPKNSFLRRLSPCIPYRFHVQFKFISNGPSVSVVTVERKNWIGPMPDMVGAVVARRWTAAPRRVSSAEAVAPPVVTGAAPLVEEKSAPPAWFPPLLRRSFLRPPVKLSRILWKGRDSRRLLTVKSYFLIDSPTYIRLSTVNSSSIFLGDLT